MSDWYPGNIEIDAPTYPLAPTIRVVDGGGTKRFHLWEKSLREALDFWEVSGLRFTVTHRELDPRYPWIALPEGDGDHIGVMAQKLPKGFNGMGDYVPRSQLPGGGYAVIAKRRIGALWELHQTPLTLNHRYAHRKLRQLICHEVGHALGFAHGGTGVMAGAWRPNAEEYAALKDYYLGGS